MRTVSKFVVLLFSLILPAPAFAQVPAPGSADPLGLAAIGVVIPFFTTGGNFSYLEVASPVGDNSNTPALHVTFFSADCVEQGTLSLPVTVNGIEVVDLKMLFSAGNFGGPFNGLLLISGVGPRLHGGFTAVPLQNPIHARVRWVNTLQHFVRTLEPISVANAEAAPSQTWNPLRTAATFITPEQGAFSPESTLYLICPSATVINTISGAPVLNPASASEVKLRIYDDNEEFLRDVPSVPCACLTTRTLTSIDPVYATAGSSYLYTEVVGSSTVNPPFSPGSFTGYVGTHTSFPRVFPPLTLDDFHRLHNGNVNNINGSESIDTQDR